MLHSAGHAIDQAVRASLGDGILSPLKGYHFADSPYVEYQGLLPQDVGKDSLVQQVTSCHAAIRWWRVGVSGEGAGCFVGLMPKSPVS